MLFNSQEFLLFFPLVTILYYLIPHKRSLRTYMLLVASYVFYGCWNPKYILLLFAVTLTTYLSALLLQKVSGSGAKKAVLASCITFNLAVLFVFKYLDFACQNLGLLSGFLLHRPVSLPLFNLVLPVGISFFTFQALGYIIDVYRGDIPAEKNFPRYALFVSFFPQLVAGPIERSKNLLPQFTEKHSFSWDNIKDNFVLILWGFFLKLVVADRIAIFVDAVYADPENYGGAFLIIASILFAFQIYCDFYGYSTIAIGAAGMMGFRLMKNFDGPYLATTVAEFWKKWHISLTSWFRDYVYIPLGGNRKGRIRTHINRLIVFLLSGLWHGAMWTYVIWGGLNGLYLVISSLLLPLKKKLVRVVGWKEEATGNHILQAVVTFLLVDITWVFFRARSLDKAVFIFKSMLTEHNYWVLFDGSLYKLGLTLPSFVVMLISILLLLMVDHLHKKGIHFRTWLWQQNIWIRIPVIVLLIQVIIIFGIWGREYDQTAFIYFQF